MAPGKQNTAFKTDDPGQDRSMQAIGISMVIGIIAIIFIAVWISVRNTDKGILWSTLGLSALIGLAALVCGGALGFLFGVPLSLQKNTGNAAAGPASGQASRGAPPARAYGNNTNLEQISDWLTKIIVGVSLTQLPAIAKHFDRLVGVAADGFLPCMDKNAGVPYVSALILFYFLCGFLAVYLWARNYLLQQWNSLEQNLFVEQRIQEASDSQDYKLEYARVEAKLNDFKKTKNKILLAETKPGVKEVVEKAKPDPIKYVLDCQKGRWGGQAEAGGYMLNAEFLKKDPNADAFQVTLIVSRTDGSVTTIGETWFFLHDSFYPDCIQKGVVAGNRASVTIISVEAFTAGAVVLDGEVVVKIELDLNNYSESPGDYKYPDVLETFDELDKREKELEKIISDSAK